MGSIAILDDNTINKIAAGEVVDRPASIVKELVENSIDAGAENILVDIERGGIKKILVQDDGTGIDSEYVKTAFIRHATSKISAKEDLDNIASLGFRGEALASIASVSKVRVVSKTISSDVGTSLEVAGGKFGEIKKVASSFQKTLETNGAKVTNVDAWGQKTLAYEIKVGRNTYKSGYYFVVNIEAGDDKAIKEFDRLALISQDIIRHLIINKED